MAQRLTFSLLKRKTSGLTDQSVATRKMTSDAVLLRDVCSTDPATFALTGTRPYLLCVVEQPGHDGYERTGKFRGQYHTRRRPPIDENPDEIHVSKLLERLKPLFRSHSRHYPTMKAMPLLTFQRHQTIEYQDNRIARDYLPAAIWNTPI